ncbi:MAG: carbamoyltransferase [Gemmatimonadetes bacterium]|nr:carbamoyltransferase [Gemmatimonadota bacterium]
MSVIVGINAYHAGASAAVLVDGVPVAAIAEERLNRVKYYAGFPSLALARCLEIAGVRAEDVTHVAIGRDSSANRAKKVEYTLRNPSRLLNLLKIRTARSELDDLRPGVAEALGVDGDRLKFRQHNVEHHLAHVASSYFASGWDAAAGLSVDGSGDFVTCMMADCRGNSIDVKHRVYVPHSLGSLYTMVCEFIGYDRYGDEGKVMGLAPLGQNTYREHFDQMLRLTDTGIELNPKFFLPFGSNQGMSIDESGQMIVHRHYSDYMVEVFGQSRGRQDEITQRDMDMAYGVQYVFEKGYMHLLNLLHRMVPTTERVALAGGCALNSVANGKLFDETPFRETWIQPAAGDDGLALGAALYVSRCVLGEDARTELNHAYLGPAYGEAEIEAALKTAGVRYERLERDELIRRTVDHLERGDVVGWFQGKMEWGPRALGNRSILAHPGRPDMKDVLNARIKRREWFRPFAPAVLAERQGEIFEHEHPSPFMLHVYKIRPEWRERLTAVNHLDNTGRLQSVERSENPLYYDLIRAFGERTGIPVLLNTSFNENEPIVNTPAEGVDCFARTRMDVLAMGPFLCTKEG